MTEHRHLLMDAVVKSFQRLCSDYDLILVEGAGSASEINLRQRDIANMGFAQRVQAPVCLIGDIDRGGVIASVVGTRTVIDPSDAQLITSFIINRFRGDPTLFDDGVQAIEQMSGWPCRGVVPWVASALKLPQEDAVVLEQKKPSADSTAALVRIAVPMLSRIANFDDMDPLRLEPNVELGFIPPGHVIPQDVDAIIIPGTKSTVGDLQFLREQGWDHDIMAFARNGGRVSGLCGGYQLMGQWIHDPEGTDGEPGSYRGLGLLEIQTHMLSTKTTRKVTGLCTQSNAPLSGYEIHVGISTGPDTESPMTQLDGKADGAISSNGLCEGTYLHGIFNNDTYRSWWLNRLASESAGSLDYDKSVEKYLDELADALESALDVDALFNDARLTTALPPR